MTDVLAAILILIGVIQLALVIISLPWLVTTFWERD